MVMPCNLKEGDGKPSKTSAVMARSSKLAAPQSMLGFLIQEGIEMDLGRKKNMAQAISDT